VVPFWSVLRTWWFKRVKKRRKEKKERRWNDRLSVLAAYCTILSESGAEEEEGVLNVRRNALRAGFR